MSVAGAISQQKSSFAPLSIPGGATYGISSATDKQCTMGIYSNNTRSEYISLAWQNMATMKSARKVSREANKKAKQYYSFTFIDDLDEDKVENGGMVEDCEEFADAMIRDDVELDEDESVYNSKFAFDDEEAWLGTRKKLEVEDILNNNDEKASVKNNIVQTKPGMSKQNVTGVLISQTAASRI